MEAGASPEVIERELAKLPAEPEVEVELWAEDEGPAATLFLSLGTQWRTAGPGFLIGLDYPAIEPTARMLGIELTPGRFLDLRHMEAVALTTMAESRRQERIG